MGKKEAAKPAPAAKAPRFKWPAMPTMPAMPPMPAVNIPFKKDLFLSTLQSFQFVSFLGNFLTTLGVLLYTLTYFKLSSENYEVFHDISLVGVVISSGAFTVQNVIKHRLSLGPVIKDDSFHYLFIGLSLLILHPCVFFTVLPFGLYSVFIVLSFLTGSLFPIFEIENCFVAHLFNSITSGLRGPAVGFASGTELTAMVMLVLRVITFRSNSLLIVLIYAVFLKLRYETSQASRDAVKRFVNFGDKVIAIFDSHQMNNIWKDVKSGSKALDKYRLVNDYDAKVE
ncbi:uncharacterized protein SPAPADRAFT_145755 [Spathaspora passalidarum NRRL Y-27907]|uniref:Uncharacterized protein n=1 Tax=Spathaspora passalidarum (strain NRRL Y-27907 / 11-Y1) TaxID=619300 RepID=G3AFL7_SPAPN|nr:uncharacterized protein SPAPADRAFT_145755 [Spathaspora passalidarum NRRL Y-27907]EGW35006.1 hypothetical protein SPAPADRAFT_145755 [Spathaspora passalidarum NRRL Y-27907]